MKFYGREKYLESLNSRHGEKGFNLFVVYGRRRVGKTELIKEFCKDKDSIYHLFSQDTSKLQKERLVERVASKSGERAPKTSDWRDAVEYIGEKLNEQKIVLALDEFPHAIKQDKSITSHFQYLVDEIISEDSESMLILSGSTISVMENQVLGYESPLYGRRTGQIDLKPFDFTQSLEVIDYSLEQAVKSYTVTGGTPLYLTAFNYSKTLGENIKNEVLDLTSTLFEEPEFLLRQELRDPSRYMSILESISQGHTTSSEISGKTGIKSTTLTNYLKKLQTLRLIEKQKPVTASRKSKKTIYKIKDNYIKFWFQNIAPRKSDIEEDSEKALKDIQKDLKHQVAETFEQISRELIKKQTDYTKTGCWWDKENEIDIVALNEKEKRILFGECKWTKEKVGTKLLKDLEDKSEKVRWLNKESREEEYALFSKNGFSEGLEDEAEDRSDLQIYRLEDISDAL